MNRIHKLLEGKWEDGTRPKDIYSQLVSKKPAIHVEAIISGLTSGNRRIENGCAELASLLSEDSPALLYPYISSFVENLDSKEAVLRWEAVCTLGNLAAIDKNRELPSCLEHLLGFLSDKSIVLQGHTVRALTKIARAYPDEEASIFRAILAAKDMFPGNRVGYLIEAMGSFLGNDGFKRRITQFVSPYAESETKSVASKAKKILRKVDPGKK
jgi:hypothetical protein